MREPRDWEIPTYLGAEELTLWHRCLAMFIARGVLEPKYELWLPLFCDIVCRAGKVRRALAELPPDANRVELEDDERLLTAMWHEDLGNLGFNSEEAFWAALSEQIQ